MHDLKRCSLSLLKRIPLEAFTTWVGVLGQGATYVQAIKIFYLESAEAVSLSACLLTLFSMICWLAYGLQRQVSPLIISNVFGIIGASCILAGLLYYG